MNRASTSHSLAAMLAPALAALVIATGALAQGSPGAPPIPPDLKAAAEGGDAQAQVTVGDIYFYGRGVAPDHAEARTWFAKAAKQQNPQAARRLGEMYAQGDGGRKDLKKAMKLWEAAEKAGDPLAAILVADQLFSELTGGRKPGPGTFAFRGGIPVADIEVVEQWYRQALERDPRPDVKERAKQALSVLASFKAATAQTKPSKK